MPSFDIVSIFIVNEDPSCPSTTVENQVSFSSCSETYIVRISAQSNAAGPFSVYTGATSGTPVFSAVSRTDLVAGQSLLLYNADQTGCATPTPTPTQTVTPTPTQSPVSPSPTPTPTVTPTPSVTPTITPTTTVTSTPTPTPSVTPTTTITPTPSVTPTVTPTTTVTPTITPTTTVTPTTTPTTTPTPTTTVTPTITPTTTQTPTNTPTVTPTITPTPSVTPTTTTTPTPTTTPTVTSTVTPTTTPTTTPTPTITPTTTITPTVSPTVTPTTTVTPTITPTSTVTPTVTPTTTPTPTTTVTPTVTSTVTPTTTPTSTVTPTITPTTTITPSVTPTITPTVTPTTTVTPTITPTVTPSPAALQALIFMESDGDATGGGTESDDILLYMLANGTGNWYGFQSSGLPDLTDANQLSDLLTWMDWPGFVTGTTNVPPAILTTIPQTTTGTNDSFGNPIEAYKFVTTEIPAGTTTGNIYYAILAPTLMTNSQVYSQIGINYNNAPLSLVNTSTDSGLRGTNVVYTGSNWPNTTYRVYSNSPGNNFNLGAPGVTDNTNNYFRGSTLS
jgi:hypothetical protein